MTNTTPAATRIRPGDTEAIIQAKAMVARYEYAASLHADTGPATERQHVEVKNLAHWRRRLEAIEAKTSTVRRLP